MKEAGLTFTCPDKAELIEATQPVRDKLGSEVWGGELYKRIVEIGRQDMS